VATNTVTSNLIESGPGKIYYAPLGTAIPTFTPTATIFNPTWTTWVNPGSTDDGITYSRPTPPISRWPSRCTRSGQ
jgi:hypothetical protein